MNSKHHIDMIRSEAEKALAIIGLPTTKSEDYKYTDVSELLAAGSRPSSGNLDAFIKSHSDIFNQYYGKLSSKMYAPQGDNVFKKKGHLSGGPVALSDSITTDLTVVYVPKNSIEKIKLSDFNRLLVIIEENSSADITIQNSGSINSVSEIFIGQSSKLTITDITTTRIERLSTTLISCQKDSSVKSVMVNINPKSLRNNLIISLDGEGASAELYGAAVADNGVADNYTLVYHNQKNCTSNELYKNIAKEGSVVAFSGNIFVSSGADGTVAMQQNHNIALSDGATIYAKPHLEIYADDVKCSHGTTTGKLDEQALFYMLQRGISESNARKLQVSGFIEDIFSKIEDDKLKELLHHNIETIL